ncbi:MAG: histidinol-phosphate transaminase [Lachnospiraceae bacterium]|nr:histidinol-phosphate transaminase [Lachnospiraceae bacterium]
MSILDKNLRSIDPYVPGDQPKLSDMIKLNTNENPYPPAPKVREALDSFEEDKLRLYPDPNSTELVSEIAKTYGVKENQVFVGVGSDDVLACCFMTFFNSGRPVIFPRITYSFYVVWAALFKVPYETFELNPDFTVNIEDFKKENGGVIIANPNAPTSVALSVDELEEIVQANEDRVVIIDEAYVDFAKDSALRLVDKYKNVVVVQTFSKSRSMAGMRIGYAIGDEYLIKALNDVRYSFNSYPMTRLSTTVGVEALKDKAYFEENIAKIVKTRAWTEEQLKALGFSFPESSANFIFATHESVKASEIYEKLKEKHIFVRYFSTEGIDNYLRITVGTDDEMKRFIEALKEILG